MALHKSSHRIEADDIGQSMKGRKEAVKGRWVCEYYQNGDIFLSRKDTKAFDKEGLNAQCVWFIIC